MAPEELDSKPDLAPEVDVSCHVCGGKEQQVVCSAEEIAEQLEWLRSFHSRRLRPRQRGSPPRNTLVDRARFTHDYATPILACVGCGLLLRNPRPRASSVTRAYALDHYGPRRLEALFDSQRDFYRLKARFLQEKLGLKTGDRVIEVGSFVGSFLAAGEERGLHMLGIDPGEEVSAYCERRGFNILRCTLENAPLEPGSADCVAIWNTLDQIPRPSPMLRAAIRVLRLGGLLAVRVPNGSCFRAAVKRMRELPRRLTECIRTGMAWNNLLAFPYLYGYSLAALDALLGRYGFYRVASTRDTLVRLADAETAGWAVWEERCARLLWNVASAIEALRAPSSRETSAPWFDAYYVSSRFSSLDGSRRTCARY
jgi:SAM-dependent methyltransferase